MSPWLQDCAEYVVRMRVLSQDELHASVACEETAGSLV